MRMVILELTGINKLFPPTGEEIKKTMVPVFLKMQWHHVGGVSLRGSTLAVFISPNGEIPDAGEVVKDFTESVQESYARLPHMDALQIANLKFGHGVQIVYEIPIANIGETGSALTGYLNQRNPMY